MVTKKKIFEAYVDVLKVNKCQHWIKSFLPLDYDRFDKSRREQPAGFDNNSLKLLVKPDAKLSIQKLSKSLGCNYTKTPTRNREGIYAWNMGTTSVT